METRSDVARDDDPVVNAYKAHIDRSLLLENLKLTPQERLLKLTAFLKSIDTLRRARRPR